MEKVHQGTLKLGKQRVYRNKVQRGKKAVWGMRFGYKKFWDLKACSTINILTVRGIKTSR